LATEITAIFIFYLMSDSAMGIYYKKI
jgi:hypothetical protein